MPDAGATSVAPFLKSALKARPGCNRVLAPEQTLKRVRAFASTCGVTRLADITGLDRTGIPTYSAVVPKSGDILSIYNGKGATREDARAGALMEAIERQTALNSRLPIVTGSFEELSRQRATLNPESVCHALRPGYRPDMPLEWVEGRDLFSGEAVMVAAKAAGYLWRDLTNPSPYKVSGSHGLASGNCLEEAVAHALCEWIERDAWTLAELRSHWLPYARAEVAGGREAAEDGWDDLESYPCLDFTGIGEPLAGMLRRFSAAGLRPVIRDVTSDLGIPTVLAAAAEDDVPGFPQAHFGVGTHPDFRIAAARAISELAQSRCVDIQAVREDISLSEGDNSGIALHTRRLERIPYKSWIHARSGSVRNWTDVDSVWNPDILDDIRLMLSRIAAAGIHQAALVEFPVEAPGIHVVRVIVPGLECYAVDHGRIGERAASFWRRHAAA